MKKYIVLIISILSLICIWGCNKSTQKTGNPGNETVPVLVATVLQKEIPVQIQTIGTVESYATVSVIAQVGGILDRVYFREGQDVKKGDLLFNIDSQPYQTALRQAEANLSKEMAQSKQAEANLAKDWAQLKNVKSELQRAAELIKAGVITQVEYDQRKTDVDSLEALVQADEAAIKTSEEAVRASKETVENAKIQLGYCTIRSPLDGRTGSLLINVGNVIKANDKPLIAINQIKPIYVSFTVPEEEIGRIRKYSSTGKIRVEAVVTNEKEHRLEGELSFMDNAVDKNTGTIRLKGLFTNKDYLLWPGQFVNVLLTLTIQTNAIVVPSESVQIGQEGQYVFVVKQDMTVELRPVEIERSFEHEILIQKGLQAGETIVTDGQLRLTPGTKVEIKQAGTAGQEQNS